MCGACHWQRRPAASRRCRYRRNACPHILDRKTVAGVQFFRSSGSTQGLTSRCTVLAIAPHRARKIVAVLLICMAVTAAVGCQFHATPSEPEHSAPTGHRHTSSTHSAVDFACLAAVLPSAVFFALLLSMLFQTPSLPSRHTLLTFLPFRPPRHATR